MEYTKLLEEKLFEDFTEDEQNVADKVLDFLNCAGSFRSFGEGVESVIMQKQSELQPIDYLRKLMKEKDIMIPDSTVRGWFEDGARPKRGIKSRETIYKLCFLLELSFEQTKDFFKKVYYDRPFNLRDVHEFIYCYCLFNGYDYQHACNIISSVEGIKDSNEQTVFSVRLIEDICELKSDEEVVQYIKEHPHSFFKNSESAKEVLNVLLEQLLMTEEEKKALKAGKSGPYYSYIAKECSMFPQELLREGSNWSSKSFMLETIQGLSLRNVREGATKKLFEMANLPREILSRFPMKQIFTEIEKAKEKAIFEEIRKMIILLYSYQFWFQVQYEGQLDWDLDIYIAQMNTILEQACLQELYYGNPYDWLFLYCSLSDRPLSTFREILAESIFPEEETAV